MKNSITKVLVSLVVFVGFAVFSNAQQAQDCQYANEEAQRSCYEKLVAYNLSELIEYPADAQFDGKEGNVIVRFTTDENNEIQHVRVLGNPDQELSKAVINAVEKLAAQPHKEMILANTVYRIPVNFNLNY